MVHVGWAPVLQLCWVFCSSPQTLLASALLKPTWPLSISRNIDISGVVANAAAALNLLFGVEHSPDS
jgi:hypothetical protein